MRYRALVVIFVLAAHATALGSDWPRWRGPLGTGEAVDADPPIHWSESENIAWKIPLPGHGKSTPIVHGKRIFLVAAVPSEQATEEQLAKRTLFADQMTPAPERLVAFLVLAFDRKTGKALWETQVTKQLPIAGVHSTNGYGSFSPVTDGDGVYVSLGSYGVFALDAESGEVRWSYEIGRQHTRRGWGEAGSPALKGETLVVVADQEGASRIHVLNAKTGEVRWIRERDEPTTWTTPLIVEAAGKTQIVVNGTTAVRSYDAETGDVLWHCDGQTVNAIPTPVTDGTLVVCASGYRGDICIALPLDRHGDLRAESEAIAWSRSRGAPYVPSLLLSDGRVYMTSGNDGIISCLDLASGEVLVDRKRLELGSVYASPIAAAGRVYVVDRDGTAAVLDQGNELEILATNVLDGQFDASPVALGHALYLRSDTHLYAIGKP